LEVIVGCGSAPVPVSECVGESFEKICWERMHLNGEPVSTIADALGVSRATVYRVLADEEGRE
jgi:transposase